MMSKVSEILLNFLYIDLLLLSLQYIHSIIDLRDLEKIPYLVMMVGTSNYLVFKIKIEIPLIKNCLYKIKLNVWYASTRLIYYDFATEPYCMYCTECIVFYCVTPHSLSRISRNYSSQGDVIMAFQSQCAKFFFLLRIQV